MKHSSVILHDTTKKQNTPCKCLVNTATEVTGADIFLSKAICIIQDAWDGKHKPGGYWHLEQPLKWLKQMACQEPSASFF
ncbi:hypothetical protein GBA52_028821 [Prunus armeniaca]|nr:hypothetical protein GBA52_028821 [Prunus armeniaca]